MFERRMTKFCFFLKIRKFYVCHLDTGINLRNGWKLYFVWHWKYLFRYPSVDETVFFKVLISGMIVCSVFHFHHQDPLLANLCLLLKSG